MRLWSGLTKSGTTGCKGEGKSLNILITGAWQDAGKHIPEIEAMGHRACFLQQERDTLPCDPAWVEGIICNGFFLHHPIEQFTNLKYIQLTSAGYDRVPMDYIKDHHIIIHNARGVYSIPMAEFAIAEVLSIYKKFDTFREQQRLHRWEKHRDILELAGKHVLIVGCGSVGTACAKRFKAFDCTVTGVDIIPREDVNYDAIVPLEQLDALLPQADIAILTVPLTPETKGLFNAYRLDLFKGILVNIARGGIIDQNALQIWKGQAVLDVFEEEPLDPNSPLWDSGNMVITPHNSFVGDENIYRLSKLILQNLEEADHER